MTTYIAILRGINVGGHKSIKMDALKKLFEKVHFENIQTYIQSGNVLFSTNEKNAGQFPSIISEQIEKEYSFSVPIVVLTKEAMEIVINNNPFLNDERKDEKFMHVTYLSEKPLDFNWDDIEIKAQISEEIKLVDKLVYIYCPGGYAKTKLNNNFLESKLKVTATTRNWKTSVELLRMANGNK